MRSSCSFLSRKLCISLSYNYLYSFCLRYIKLYCTFDSRAISVYPTLSVEKCFPQNLIFIYKKRIFLKRDLHNFLSYVNQFLYNNTIQCAIYSPVISSFPVYRSHGILSKSTFIFKSQILRGHLIMVLYAFRIILN